MNDSSPQFGSTRSVTIQGPGLIAQILAIIIFLAIVAVLFIFIVPLAIVLLFIGLIVYAWYRIKFAFRRAHDPNGPLDGRRNVRVVERDD
ncbi:MAG: hypothetical protein ACF8MF_12060 [Phycisphaerales bacterium JB052]